MDGGLALVRVGERLERVAGLAARTHVRGGSVVTVESGVLCAVTVLGGQDAQDRAESCAEPTTVKSRRLAKYEGSASLERTVTPYGSRRGTYNKTEH